MKRSGGKARETLAISALTHAFPLSWKPSCSQKTKPLLPQTMCTGSGEMRECFYLSSYLRLEREAEKEEAVLCHSPRCSGPHMAVGILEEFKHRFLGSCTYFRVIRFAERNQEPMGRVIWRIPLTAVIC